MSLHIVHLFPTDLGLFGDVGNVIALDKRAVWSGIETHVTSVELADGVPTDGDIYVIGSGSTAGVRAVAARVGDLRSALETARSHGASIVAISAGLHLLTNRIEFADGTHLDGVGLVDTTTVPLPQRRVGEVFGDYAGFVNTGHELEGGNGELTFVRNGIIGTHLHGPLLPMNPALADDLIERHAGRAVAHDDPRVVRATVAAEKSRAAIRARLGL